MNEGHSGRLWAIVKVTVTLSILGAALFVILSQKYPDDYAKWAFGVSGLVVGYWLR